MKLIERGSTVFERINDYLAGVAGAIIILLMLSVSYSVAARYIWGFTTAGMFELWEYSLLWIPFLGAAWLLKTRGHVSVDILINHLKPRSQAILQAIIAILCAFVCLILTVFGIHAVWVCFRDGIRIIDDLNPPKGLVIAIIPIGSFLLFIGFLRMTHRYIRELKAPPEESIADNSRT